MNYKLLILKLFLKIIDEAFYPKLSKLTSLISLLI
jgi:hypothetical protein